VVSAPSRSAGARTLAVAQERLTPGIAIERPCEEFKRRIKTQTVLPSADTAVMPFRILRRDNRRIDSKAEQKAMNPVRWKREHQIALLGAAVVGAATGIFAGTRQVEPSADHYWIWLGIWGAAGTVMGATGGFIRQLSRSRTSS
jgi:hypothetical protein